MRPAHRWQLQWLQPADVSQQLQRLRLPPPPSLLLQYCCCRCCSATLAAQATVGVERRTAITTKQTEPVKAAVAAAKLMGMEAWRRD